MTERFKPARRLHPDDARERRAGAMDVAEKALVWFDYSTWHPDFDTLNFIKAYEDFKAGIPIEDVYWARKLKLPEVNRFGQRRPV